MEIKQSLFFILEFSKWGLKNNAPHNRSSKYITAPDKVTTFWNCTHESVPHCEQHSFRQSQGNIWNNQYNRVEETEIIYSI